MSITLKASPRVGGVGGNSSNDLAIIANSVSDGFNNITKININK